MIKHTALLAAGTLLSVSGFLHAGDPLLMMPLPAWQALPGLTIQTPSKAPGFADAFSPLTDPQVVTLAWQGINQSLNLCGEGLALWELTEPGEEQTDISEEDPGCFHVQPLLPSGQAKLYILNIDGLDIENSGIDTGNDIWTLSTIKPDFAPEVASDRKGKEAFLRLGLHPERVTPENVHVADGLLAILDSRNADPSALIQQCPWWSCCCKPKTGGSGSRSKTMVTNPTYQSADDNNGGDGFNPGGAGGGDGRKPPYDRPTIEDVSEAEEASLEDLLKRLMEAISDDTLVSILVRIINNGHMLPGQDIDRAFRRIGAEPGEWLRTFLVLRANPAQLNEFVLALSRENRANLAWALSQLNHSSLRRRETVRQQAPLPPPPEDNHLYEAIPGGDQEGEDQYISMASAPQVPVSAGAIKALVKDAVKSALRESQIPAEPPQPTVQSLIAPGDSVNRPGTPQMIPEDDIPWGWSEEDEINAMLGLPPRPLPVLSPAPDPDPDEGFDED